MSPTENGNGGVKTLAIRMHPARHAQLSLIAQLRGTTITDEIHIAIDSHIQRAKAIPEIAGKADEALAAIERDAASRREAIATLFGPAEPAASDSEQPVTPIDEGRTARGRARRSGTEDSN